MNAPLDARTHVYRHRPEVPAEDLLVEELLRPGSQALDIGTGATGRTATLLRDAGAEVHSIEINPEAIAEFAATPDRHGIHLVRSDMTMLPFPDGAFDVVLIGLHGSDYLLGREERRRAFAEVGRVLRPGGSLVFNAFNPVGLAMSPSGLGNAEFRRVRARYLASARFLRATLVDINGLRLHQATPGRIIREVERAGPLVWRAMTNLSGSTRSRLLVSLFASSPYYVFARTSAP